MKKAMVGIGSAVGAKNASDLGRPRASNSAALTKRNRKSQSSYALLLGVALVVIVFVPVAFLVPPVLMLIPPLMPLTPATLPRRVQFATLVICPSAVASGSFDCLVELMLRADNSALASVDIFRLKVRQCGEKQNSGEKD